MDKVYFPEDFFAENVKPGDASLWTNAQVLSALDQIFQLTVEKDKTGMSDFDSCQLGRNYRVVANEIRRRMQANVENFTLLEVERYYPVDKETGQIEDEKDMPDKYESVFSADCGLEVLADGDDDIVFVGISAEDYMRTWNRMVDRKRNRLFYYDDENDDEHMKID